jgi:hypothetical protein
MFYSFFLVSWGGVRLSPFCTSATTGLLYHLRMIGDAECGAVGGTRIGMGNWSTWRKPAPVPLYPPQIPYDLTWARTWVAMVVSRRLTPELCHGLACFIGSSSDCTASNHKWLVNEEFKEDVVESGGGLTEVQSPDLSEGTEENHAVLQSR